MTELAPLTEPGYLEAPVQGSPEVTTGGGATGAAAAGARYLEAPKHMASSLYDQSSRHSQLHMLTSERVRKVSGR